MKKLICLLLISSCASWLPTIRSPYSLTTNNNFIVSNIYTNPTNLERDNHDLIIKYDLIVKNIAPSDRALDVKDATINYRETVIPMNCKKFDTKETTFKVRPEETFRLQCEGLVKNTKNLGDTKMIIQIPLEKSFAIFTYVVRSEDFQ